MTATEPTDNRLGVLRRMARSWFELTHDEQKVLLLILAVFLLGLAVRSWHLKTERQAPTRPAQTAATSKTAGD